MKTIAAISTPLATGGIAMVRISGPDAIPIAQAVLDRTDLKEKKGYRAFFTKYIDENGNCFDEGVGILYRAPKSFTGEDVVELCCHGGVTVAKKLLRSVLHAGADMAQAGEFSKRAFLNGKMDLTKAEGIAALISARSDKAALAASDLMRETLFHQIQAYSKSLLEMAAQVQSSIDYPDEESGETLVLDIDKKAKEIRRGLGVLLQNYDAGKVVFEGITIVLAGRPNAGKSTWMNLLSGHEKSIVTDLPGTTRDVIEEHVQLAGIPCRLCDTAGITGKAADKVEKIGVEKALNKLQTADIILFLLDGSEALAEEDRRLLEQEKERDILLLLNKSDREKKLRPEELPEGYRDRWLYTSKDDPGSISKVKEWIAKKIQSAQMDPSIPVLANERQRSCIQRACRELEQIGSGLTLDLCGVLLEDALQPLLELTGEKVQKKIVDEIFSEFCVGK